MIEWTNELFAQIDSYSRAALSYMGHDDYPVTLPLPFTFDQVEHRFTLPLPVQPLTISAEGVGQTSLTLLRYDPQVANDRYLMFYGSLAERANGWSLTPSRLVL